MKSLDQEQYTCGKQKFNNQCTIDVLNSNFEKMCRTSYIIIHTSFVFKSLQIQSTNYESGVETGSNDTASVASSGSRHSVSSGISRDGRGGLDQDQDVFEVPRTIRFPPAAPNKSTSELVICKWELCGTEFDSTGKLLDHLKVSFLIC